ncbi:histidine--tRNA ligase [Patescibacteria group bacterium]|nr:histidine--tRNA ligase [Patescibacteria group bacterium]
MNMAQNKKLKSLSGIIALSPSDQILFNKIKDIIRNSYELFGFEPTDTPVIDRSSVLLAKVSPDTEKEIYKFQKGNNDLALRFDLTVPFAKYVVFSKNDINFPFRRYEIGKSFRGERPQKGRYREFYQCDADIISKNNLSFLNDADIINLIYKTLINLDIKNKFIIKINNRKILLGFLKDFTDKTDKVMLIIDKLNKISKKEAKKQLKALNIKDEDIEKIFNFIKLSKGNNVLENLRTFNVNNSLMQDGVEELSTVISYLKDLNLPESHYEIDLSIVRGLDYYTGTVFETFLKNDKEIGSIASGGRYDNLCDLYGNEKYPGVGMSIGLNRLFYALRDLKLIKNVDYSISKVLILPMDKNRISYSLNLITKLRENNINASIFENEKNLKNKLEYANKIGVPYIVIIGENEENNSNYTLKNMKSGEQFILNIDKLIKKLS